MSYVNKDSLINAKVSLKNKEQTLTMEILISMHKLKRIIFSFR